MPGHFLVRDPATPDRLIDAFDRGRQLDRAACERLLRAVAGGAAQLTTDMLATTGPWAILARMLANLDRSFEVRQDREALAWVSDMRIHIPKASLADRTQLAGRLAAIGRFDVAATLLEDAATAVVGEQVRNRLLSDATELRARLN